MKFLILILILALSVPPLQAGFCDMDMGKTQDVSHHMDHSGQDMDHSGQDQSDNDAHSCCDSDNSDSSGGCDSDMNCGVCFTSVSAISVQVKFTDASFHQYSPGLSSGVVLPSHTSPPFRPPIA